MDIQKIKEAGEESIKAFEFFNQTLSKLHSLTKDVSSSDMVKACSGELKEINEKLEEQRKALSKFI